MAVTKLTMSGFKPSTFNKYDDFLAGNAAYDPAATWLISSVTGNGSATTLSLTSIPSGYSALQIRIMAKDVSGTGSYISMRMNGDSGTNYARHYLFGNASSVVASGGGTLAQISNAARSGGSQHATSIIDIQDYTSTTKYKTTRSFWGEDSNGVDNNLVFLHSGLWMSASAITQLDFINANSVAFASTTKISLYGFKG